MKCYDAEVSRNAGYYVENSNTEISETQHKFYQSVGTEFLNLKKIGTGIAFCIACSIRPAYVLRRRYLDFLPDDVKNMRGRGARAIQCTRGCSGVHHQQQLLQIMWKRDEVYREGGHHHDTRMFVGGGE